jgi:hypothetical protein
MLPDVPTFAEAGVPGVVVTGWLGIYGPPACRGRAQKLGAAIVEVVKQPEIRRSSAPSAFEPTGQGVEAFTAHHAAEVKRWVAFYTESACGSSHGAVSAAPIVSLRGVGKTFGTGTLALDGSISTCARASSCRCSGPRAAASRRRCASSPA